ncbi:MAG: phosphoribosyltransferase family protein [Candidatus Peribacteraceae bacterium]|nr:phosphoribosyltransferase family protein [Candidatus Peribacteraceae bacterium]
MTKHHYLFLSSSVSSPLLLLRLKHPLLSRVIETATLTMPFDSRTTAGRILAGRLGNLSGEKKAIVLGLVRGGVVVGKMLSTILTLPLYPYIVRKIGHPENREYGVGALAEGGTTYLDERTMRAMGLTWNDLEPVIDEEMEELRRRKEMYAVRPRPSLKGKIVILVDDGAATGNSMLAAIEDVRKAEPKEIVVALPVAPQETADAIMHRADRIIVLESPGNFEAVGKWYGEFGQVEDEEVIDLLMQSQRLMQSK